MRAKLCVPPGAIPQCKTGDRFAPSQVFFIGIQSPSLNAGLDRGKVAKEITPYNTTLNPKTAGSQTTNTKARIAPATAQAMFTQSLFNQDQPLLRVVGVPQVW